ncbi:hypothetical protein QJS10_CPA06g01224 [Acorus calamus]|uniref:Uncharacterized protein n=1 Tax=Acorus calamus TaxID=4465 RepID=A0AAV9EIM0_ACOCL|nr:hypothetical protein QJS10_CPA06g01224 [Acorus calamus]
MCLPHQQIRQFQGKTYQLQLCQNLHVLTGLLGRHVRAKFLSPDESKVGELISILREKKIGIVAHFHMDQDVQGLLTAAQKLWPHIYISD